MAIRIRVSELAFSTTLNIHALSWLATLILIFGRQRATRQSEKPFGDGVKQRLTLLIQKLR